MRHPHRDEIAHAVSAFLKEIEPGGHAEVFQVGDDVRGDLDWTIRGGMDKIDGRRVLFEYEGIL